MRALAHLDILMKRTESKRLQESRAAIERMPESRAKVVALQQLKQMEQKLQGSVRAPELDEGNGSSSVRSPESTQPTTGTSSTAPPVVEEQHEGKTYSDDPKNS